MSLNPSDKASMKFPNARSLIAGCDGAASGASRGAQSDRGAQRRKANATLGASQARCLVLALAANSTVARLVTTGSRVYPAGARHRRSRGSGALQAMPCREPAERATCNNVCLVPPTVPLR